MKYKLLSGEAGSVYALIFEKGDLVMKALHTFARDHRLKASRFTAIGAFSEAELGFFDYGIKDYKKIQVREQVEVLSFMGDISLYGDDSTIHAHVVLGRSDGTAMGGHLMEATVHPTLEVIVEESPSYLQRRMDPETGLPLIRI